MTIKKLKEAIANLPDTMEVFVTERKTEFKYGLVNSASVKTINFLEDDGKPLAKGKVLVIDEE